MYSSNEGSGSAGWKRLLCAVPFLLIGCGAVKVDSKMMWEDFPEHEHYVAPKCNE